mmetsp:Transcript_33173/g.71138  ORF Transcript_33173/g.71138 Transcript_33173/m.71138 type:complete len:603 (+) Transcript_33173:108-1916(+)
MAPPPKQQRLSRRGLTPKLVLGVAAAAAPAVLLTGCFGGNTKDTPSPSPTPSSDPSPSPSPKPGPDDGKPATTETSTTTTAKPEHVPGPMECSEEMTKLQCSSCEWVGEDDGHEECTECRKPYTLQKATGDYDDPICTYDCKDFVNKEKPGRPAHGSAYNGIEWPAVCFPERESHFFLLGDWGGTCGWNGIHCVPDRVPWDMKTCEGKAEKGLPGKPCPFANRKGEAKYEDFEGRIQWTVGQRMMQRYEDLDKDGKPPRFVINLGDAFYPGGIDVHCGVDEHDAAKIGSVRMQFKQVWNDMYPKPLTSMEWWGVLGNHDYGGVCYLKAWDQQVFHTWRDSAWVMPGQYWKRLVQYETFTAEFFFIDGNYYDVMAASPGHDMCAEAHNPGDRCQAQMGGIYPPSREGEDAVCHGSGPQSPEDCKVWFKNLWTDNVKWLREQVVKSEADWQIIVNHYPASYPIGQGRDQIVWKQWLEPMGVDAYLSGHTHWQHVYYQTEDQGPGLEIMDMGGTVHVVSGGGGGISADVYPLANGQDDAYGFMDVALTAKEMTIYAYSHGGTSKDLVLRSTTVVPPIQRQPISELKQRGFIFEAEEEAPARDIIF